MQSCNFHVSVYTGELGGGSEMGGAGSKRSRQAKPTSTAVTLKTAPNPLEKAVTLLDSAAALAKKVAKPVNEITDGLQSAKQVVTDIENFIDGLNDNVITAGELGDLCYELSEFPPPVDAIMDTLGTALREFSTTMEEFLTPLNDFKQDALSKAKNVLGDIQNVCDKINTALTFFATRSDCYVEIAITD